MEDHYLTITAKFDTQSGPHDLYVNSEFVLGNLRASGVEFAGYYLIHRLDEGKTLDEAVEMLKKNISASLFYIDFSRQQGSFIN